MTRRSADSQAAKAARPVNRGGRPKRARTDAGLLAALAAAGSLSALATRLGVSVGAISQWSRIPEKDVARVAEAYSLSRHALRPDLFDATDLPIVA